MPAGHRRTPTGILVLGLIVAAAATFIIFQDTRSRDAAEQQFDRAMRYAAGQRWSEAIATYREVLSRDPDNARAGAGLARALFHNGNAEDALREYQGLWERGLVNVKELDLFGWEVIQDQAYDVGEQLYREACERVPDDLNAQLNLGYMVHMQHRVEEAIAIYEQAALLAPESLAPHVGLARAYLDLGRDAEAWAQVAVLPLPFDSAARAIHRDNLVADQLWLSADTLLALRARMCEPWLDPSEPSQADAIRHSVLETVALYRYLLLSGADDADVHGNWVAAMDNLGHVDETVSALRDIVDERIEAATAFASVAHILLDRGKVALAQAHAEEAARYDVSLAPGDAARLAGANAA